MRGRKVGIEGVEKRHLAGRETLIAVGYCSRMGAAQWPKFAAALSLFVRELSRTNYFLDRWGT